MIAVDQLAVMFGATPLFTNVCFNINKKDRIALVGKNGAGKSTLLKILSGSQKASSGSVAIEKEATIGYLPQVMVLSDDHTVIEETEKAFADIRDLQQRIERENQELAERDDYESQDYLELVERFAHDNDRFQLMGGLNYRAQMERTLLGLGFVHEDFDRPTKEFSGGWRMRIELAKILLRSPDILLLDEPTNHLDIESIRWLEQFLQHSASAVVLVSHDRAFLNNVTNYKAKYDDFVRLREERREQQLRAYENQQKEIADIKDFIERFRYKPTKAVQVQSRIKQLEKIVPIVVDEVDRSSLHLKFPPCSRTGDYPLICEDLRKDYGSHCVFHDVNLTLKRGEKVAFVGKNGAGKSTLVKCIMGEIPYTGHLKLGHNVAIGYYAQNQAQLLDENLTVFDTIDSVAKGDIRLKIRDILGAFMFGGEASDKKVKVLSGGERSRLAMIRLLLEPVNFLILDEPTNHLDMRTKDVLKEAIQAFDGTVILVSHDRDFLDGLVTKVYEFGDGLVREHLGGIYDFLQKKELQDLKSLEATPTQSTANPATPQQAQGKLSYEEQKEHARLLRKVEKEVKEKEEAISRIEAALQDLEQQMSSPEGATDTALITQYASLQKELEQTMADWEAAASRLEEMQSK